MVANLNVLNKWKNKILFFLITTFGKRRTFFLMVLYSNIHIRNTMYTVTGVGIMANALLLLVHISLHITGLKDTYWIIGLLALTHLLMLLTMGFIAADTFTSQAGLWGDITCKSVAYLYRLMRGLSISATCLLSVLQALTLSPRSSCLAKFKPKSPQDRMRSLLFLWVFYMSLSAHFSISAVDNSTVTSQALIFFSDSCTILSMRLMALSTGYMVTLLHKHKRQCQQLHGTSLSPKASPEQRATRAILVLMGFFVLMYCLDCIVSSSRTMWNNYPVCFSVQIMVSKGYATISSLVFICTVKQNVAFLKCLWGKDSQH
uniref:Vomeronasal type-1 receptor n=1 Tax=Marmota marmota marmota TaxID=9994 RepID=A0A8C5YSG4_MARMA